MMDLVCSVAGCINSAFHQNSIPIVQEIKLDNGSDAAVSGVTVQITSEPAVVEPLTIRIDRIEPGALHYIRQPDLRLNAALLNNLTEGLTADLIVTLAAADGEILRRSHAVNLLPPSHWGGVAAAPELLAAFVRPNDPAVDVILHRAAQKLIAAEKPSAIDGYAGGSAARSWDLAAAIYAAIADQGLIYVLPPASFERTGQKIRSPSDILARKTATCLDTTLLYAACLEQAGLDPMVVLTAGHAFAGLWLHRVDCPGPIVDDAQLLRKRRDLQELILIETTLLTQSPAGRFSAAVTLGASQIEESAPAPLELAVDIRRARQRQIRPLDLGEGGERAPKSDPSAERDMGLDAAPVFTEEAAAPMPPDQPIDRVERWKRRLLDLSMRNKLLNFKDGKKSIPIDCPDAARFEQLLATEQKFKFVARSAVLTETDQRSANLHRERYHDDGRRQFLIESLASGELHTDLNEAELESRLTELYRLARTALEEGGANILFLAFGFLHWTETDTAKSARAPVLLFPVSLQRSNIRAGFRLTLLEEEARFNPTLLELLRQDFEMKIPELERDLPKDAAGQVVQKIWQILRTQVRDLKGWEVTSEVVLSTFSFTKFLMWRDLVERIGALKQSPVVRHLIDTPKQSYGEAADFPDARRIDIDYHPREIFAPLSADSSQLAAVMAADRGKDFILFGPPGTGKSQTIANIIAQCLASNKTILFVSQKTAALEVVQRRLNEIGLGDYCLEVHSAKAQKSAVLSKLKAAWENQWAPSDEDWTKATAELGDLRDELNRLVAALHRRRPNGLTAYEAFGRVIADRERFAGLRFDWAEGVEHGPEDLASFRQACRDLETALKAVGLPTSHPLHGIETRTWTPAWRQDLTAAIDALCLALPALGEAAASFARTIGLDDIPKDHATLRGLEAFGAALLAEEAWLGIHFLGPAAPRRREACKRLAELQARAAPLWGRLAAAYHPTIFTLDLKDYAERWEQAAAANFLLRGARQKKLLEALAPHIRGKAPEDPGTELRILVSLGEILAATEALAPELAVFAPVWDGLGTDPRQLAALAAWAEAMGGAIRHFAPATGFAPGDLVDYVIRLWTDYSDLLAPEGEARLAFDGFAAAWTATELAFERLNQRAGRAGSRAPLAVGEDWIERSSDIVKRWKSNLHRAQPWCFWNEAAARATETGLGVLVAAAQTGATAPAEVERAFAAAYARWWADQLVTADPVLRAFLAERHEDAIERFRGADAAVADLSKQILRARLRGDVPPPTAFGSDTEWGLLSRELTKKARHMPLRQLFTDLPTALTRLTPCLMMSPLSIAQYLPPGSRLFDVVIFDEASQIPAWDAIGAIARGKQVIIVGDPEQLPPTNVGERGIDDVDDGMDVEDQESILDECLASNIPSHRLQWHYRSRHESLIAFANHSYYKGQLITFPSAQTEDRAVHLVPVPGGIYERGKGRTNLKEAQAVAADVIRRLKQPSFAAEKRSLGVVTFNGEQQRLIENLIDQERRAHPEVEMFFDATRWQEPVFVKNLETVQGDERDIILFSVTFAPDATGRPISTISSLNKDGGYRRLNVAITRARREMAIFSTLRADQIALSGAGARGIRDFKHFLEFAERGPKALAEAAAPLNRGTDSPFEDAVKEALERRGWIVHPQVGVSAFRIDLGIVHPDAAGRYLAGVECDGASYHRSATARDRDRLREILLCGLGWRIRRVWSTEWWMDAPTALQKLHDRLTADLAEDRALAEIAANEASAAAAAAAAAEAAAAEAAAAAAEAAAPIVPDAPDPGLPGGFETTAAPLRLYADPMLSIDIVIGANAHYRKADPKNCGTPLDPAAFHESGYRPALQTMVAHVIDVEGPLFDDVLVARIARAHEFGRTGARIRETILGAVEKTVATTREGERLLFWPRGMEPAESVPFRPDPAQSRDYGDIPLVELISLARHHAAPDAGEEDILRAMARDCGIGRMSEATRARLRQALRL